MAKVNLYTVSGTKTSLNLPKAFQEKVNKDLLAQAVRVYQDRSHPGLSKVKTRRDINLSTAKVWRQKGTGRARHGARSAPIFVGGGVAHGPKGVKRTLRMSKKMAKKSLLIALSSKAGENKIVAVNNLNKINKTKDAQKLIYAIIAKENLKKESAVSVITGKENVQTRRSFRNLKNAQILNVENLNVLDIYLGGLLVFDKEALNALVKDKFASSVKTEKKVGKITKTVGISAKEKKVVKKEAKVEGVAEKRKVAKRTTKKGIK
jgi:large subunit ribosomal protein L4